MNILWIFAHPEPHSFNGALRDHGVDCLEIAGHRVQHSDLYAMGWKATADARDFTSRDPSDRLYYGADSEAHYRAGTLSKDIQAEHSKLAWADHVIIQFPLWWYSTPAILTGWFDRVLTKGFAYGVPDPEHPGRMMRYGDGPLSGKRAMLVVTAGGRETAFGPRGVNGYMEEILFPLQHGTLWYIGMDVLPPVVTYGANRLDEAVYASVADQLTHRLSRLNDDEPIPYRHQNRGDYDEDLVLKGHLAEGQGGLGVHIAR